MLVLSRKLHEEIVIYLRGEEVRVFVAELRGDKIRLGIGAPADAAIWRREVRDRLVAGGIDPRVPPPPRARDRSGRPWTPPR